MNGITIHLIEEILNNILQVPKDGIESVAKGSPSKHFVQEIGRLPGLSCAGIPKKFVKGRFQLYCEFLNKVIVSE